VYQLVYLFFPNYPHNISVIAEEIYRSLGSSYRLSKEFIDTWTKLNEELSEISKYKC